MNDGFSVIAGGQTGPSRIVLSLVHPRERIDIFLTEVLAIEAVPDITFALPDGRSKTNAVPHVELTLAPQIRARVHRLTSVIVGEAMDLVVGGEVVSSPIVREPLGMQGAFNIKMDGKRRKLWPRNCARAGKVRACE